MAVVIDGQSNTPTLEAGPRDAVELQLDDGDSWDRRQGDPAHYGRRLTDAPTLLESI
jgi:hypothetical protein